MSSRLRRGIDGIDKRVGRIVATRRIASFDPATTTVVAGAGRSGTTWLAELLAGAFDALEVFEPLHPQQTPAGEAGFGHLGALAPDESLTASQRTYLHAALAGEIRSSWTIRPVSARPAMGARTRLIKFVRANGYLHQLAPLTARPPIVIVRGPIATVSSQLRQHGWGHPGPDTLRRVLARFPDLLGLLDRLDGQPHQMRALAWVIETRCALSTGGPRPWALVHYEQLVEAPATLLDRLGRVVGEPITVPVDVDRPSRTAFADRPVAIEVTSTMATEIAEIAAEGVAAYAGDELVAPAALEPTA
ncbi:MAG: hypothetical protein AAF081_00705 [Actinomycetota bacterium]